MDISYGNTHVIPFIESKPIMNYIRRINVGYNTCFELFKSVTKLKFPEIQEIVSNTINQKIFQNFSFVATDY